MRKSERDELVKILGWEPGRSFRVQLLQEVKDTGKSLQEVASKYQLPQLFTDFECTGFINVPGEGRMSIEDYKKQNPWKKIVILHRRKYETEKQ